MKEEFAEAMTIRQKRRSITRNELDLSKKLVEVVILWETIARFMSSPG